MEKYRNKNFRPPSGELLAAKKYLIFYLIYYCLMVYPSEGVIFEKLKNVKKCEISTT